MTGNFTNVTATVPWPVLKIPIRTEKERGRRWGKIIFILNQVCIKSVF